MFLNFAIRRTPLCHYHLTLDTLRSVARRGAWDSTISVSQALRKEMELVTEQHLAATWRLDMTCAPLNVKFAANFLAPARSTSTVCAT
jgi:lipopolysaccharide biosynthesis regulator YciM